MLSYAGLPIGVRRRCVACLIIVIACWTGLPPLLAEALDYRVDHIGKSEGLSQSHVLDIMQDRYGLMWFATRDGLNLYDGYTFTAFRHKPFDSLSPANCSVEGVAEAADGSIWIIAGNQGVSRMDRRSRRFSHYRHDPADSRSLISDLVTVVFCDSRGTLWIGSDRGLCRYNPSQENFSVRPLKSSVHTSESPPYIRELYEDRAGSLWVYTESAVVYRLDTGRTAFKMFRLPAPNLPCLGEDEKGLLYLGGQEVSFASAGPLAVRMDRRNGTVEPLLPESDRLKAFLPWEGVCQVIHAEADGALWILFRSIPFGDNQAGAGIYRLAQGGTVPAQVVALEGRPVGAITKCFRSADGLLWIGTRRGLIKIAARQGRFVTQRKTKQGGSLSNSFIRSILVGPDSVIWVGTDNGLNRQRPGDDFWQRMYFATGRAHVFSENAVNSIYIDDDGSVLLGTNAGLLLPDTTAAALQPADYRDSEGQPLRTRIWSLQRDQDGLLWVGTLLKGIQIYDSLRRCIATISEDTHSPADYTGGLVWSMLQDSRGEFWIGTSKGLNRRLPGTRRFATYRYQPGQPGSLSGNNICGLYEDRDGTFWALAHGGGLNRYDRDQDRFVKLTTAEGLHDDSVYGMLQAEDGAYWISSNNGLARILLPGGSQRIYTERDGLQDNEFSFHAFAAAPDGRLLFGGVNGLTIFHPARLRDNDNLPRVVLTAFNVFDTLMHAELRDGDTIRVDYEQNFLSFEFAALDYVDPAQNRYAYKLEGFNKDWVYCGTRRYAVFTNLDPGEYRFRAKGSNNDGRWNEEGCSVILQVVPPFWMTTWFRSLTIGGGLLLLLSGAALRLRMTLARNALKRRLLEYRLQTLRLQMNPHFIFNALASIEHLILKRENRRASEYLNRFATLVRGMLESAGSATISLAEELDNLRLYLELESLRFDHRFQYDLKVDAAVAPRSLRIPPLLIQPYVENALRHSMIHSRADGRLLIHLERRDETLYCRIEDNGIGRQQARSQRRSRRWRPVGMSVTGERLRLLNSFRRHQVTCRVSDVSGEDNCVAGTLVELWIPLDFSHPIGGDTTR